MLVESDRRLCEAASDDGSRSHILLQHAQCLGSPLGGYCISLYCQSKVKILFASLESLKRFLGVFFINRPF